MGINKKQYTKTLARKMLKLRKEGKSNVAIAKKFKLNPFSDSGLVVPIIKFLLTDEVEDILESYNEHRSNAKKQSNIENSNTNEKIKICLLCDKEFIEPKTVSGQKYCPDCKKKYKDTEIRTLVGVKEGKYDKQTAIEASRLKDQGFTNKEIGEMLNVPKPLITPIIDLFLTEKLSFDSKNSKEDNIRNCLVCGKEIKGSSSKKYCDECNKKYDNHQRIVLAGINEGKYDKGLAAKLYDLLNQGLTKKQAAKRLKLSNPSLINPILEYLYYDDVKPIDISQGAANTSFINKSDLGSLDLDNYFIRTDYDNGSNILVKGAIEKENRNTLFSFLAGKGINVKDMSLKENLDGSFELGIDLDVDEDYVDDLIFELNVLGIKNE